MDDDSDQKDDKDLEEDADREISDDFDDDLIARKPKRGGAHEDDPVESLDALADEEDVLLPEDNFDDEDLW